MFSFSALPKKLVSIVVISAALTISAAAADLALGTVDANALNLRSSASASAPVVTVAPRGDKVIILDQNGSWYRVSYQYKEGYMSAEFLKTTPNAKITGEPISGMATGSVVNVRSLPETTGNVVCQLRENTYAEIIGIENGWYQIQYQSYTGYIHPDYFIIHQKPNQSAETAAAAFTSSPNVSEDASAPAEAAPSAENSDLQSQIVDYAKQYIGTKYRSGGRSPSTGFDCSGFVYYVYKNFGYTLTPGASTQMDKVSIIKKAELLPGDLVFFNTGSARRASHVGIYIGDNKFIHAVKPGTKLRISSLSEAYYSKYYVGSGRVLS